MTAESAHSGDGGPGALRILVPAASMVAGMRAAAPILVPLTMTVKVAIQSSRETRWIALLMESATPQEATWQTEPKTNSQD